MPQAELELEVAQLREKMAQFAVRDSSRGKKIRQLAYFDLCCGVALLVFSVFLHRDPLQFPTFVSAIVLILMGSNTIALAGPRATAG